MQGANKHPLWWDLLPPQPTRPTINGDIETDIAIVGGGYTGLWTAYYLQQLDPSLSITVIDANTIGFGASSRNGGWASALFPVSIGKLTSRFGGTAALAMQQTMFNNLDDIEQVIANEQFDCDWNRGGTLAVARSDVQAQRAREEVSTMHRWGFDDQYYRLLSASEVLQQVNMTNVHVGSYTPYCAAIHPAKLVHALANCVEHRGATLYEHSPATSITSHNVYTAHGTIKAKYIMRATEGFTQSLEQHERQLMPLYSLMLATQPLPDSTWNEIGLRKRETFTDYRNLIIYGQRTADNRLAFGGRGARYHFGSTIKPEFDQVHDVHEMLHQTLIELFPIVADATITHTWGGPLGVARDWMPSVGFDYRTGLAWAGGYVGDGVSTSHLAGKTVAHLITGQPNTITTLPWVNYQNKQWEPEPLRWIGANLGLVAAKYADSVEGKTGKPSWLSGLVGKLTGH